MQKRKFGLPSLPGPATAPNPPPPPPPPPLAAPVKTPLRVADANRSTYASNATLPQKPLASSNAEKKSEATTATTTATATSSSSPNSDDFTLSNSDNDDDNEGDFNLYVPLDGVNREPVATPVHQRQRCQQQHNNNDSVERSNNSNNCPDTVAAAALSSIRRSKHQPPSHRHGQQFADASTSTASSSAVANSKRRLSAGAAAAAGQHYDPRVGDHHDDDDDIKHFQAQLLRCQKERDTYSADAVFFRDAADMLQSNLVRAKQQLARHVEFSSEPMLRCHIEEFEAESRAMKVVACFKLVSGALARTSAATIAERAAREMQTAQRAEFEHLLQTARGEASEATAELAMSRDASSSLMAEREVLRQQCAQHSADLTQSQQSIRVMTAAWQEKFSALRAQHEKLQHRFSVAAASECRLRAAEDQLRKMKAAAQFVEARALLACAQAEEARMRLVLEAAWQDECELMMQRCLVDSQLCAVKAAECDRTKRRFEAVSAENEALVKHNAELQNEVIELRRKVLLA